MFDTHAYVRILIEGGFTETQAVAQMEALKLVLAELATKQDLKDLATELRGEMKDLEHRLTVRMGAALMVSTALTISVLGALIAWVT